MTSFNTFPKWHDNTGGASGGQLRRAITQRHSDYVSGRPILLPDRDSAGDLPLSRATSQALRFNSACLGLYHLNAQLHVSRQAVRNALNHLKSLRSFVGFDAFEARARKGQSNCLIPTKRLPK